MRKKEKMGEDKISSSEDRRLTGHQQSQWQKEQIEVWQGNRHDVLQLESTENEFSLRLLWFVST